MGFTNAEPAVEIESGFGGVFFLTSEEFAEEPAGSSPFIDFVAEGFEFLYCFGLGGLVGVRNVAVE